MLVQTGDIKINQLFGVLCKQDHSIRLNYNLSAVGFGFTAEMCKQPVKTQTLSLFCIVEMFISESVCL